MCAAEGIAWVPFLPLGGAFPGLPTATDESVVHAMAESLGVTASQVGLARLLHRAPNMLLIPGTVDVTHLDVNTAVGEITLDTARMAMPEAVESRSDEVPIG